MTRRGRFGWWVRTPNGSSARRSGCRRPAPAACWVVEPHVDDLPPGLAAGGRTALASLDRALAADVILLLTDHQEFRRIDPRCLAGKRVIDTRGIWRE